MVLYEKASDYLQTCTTLQTKIAAIDEIIDKLLLSAAESAESANYSEYFLDDGQTKISTKYRSATDVSNAVLAFERLRNVYLNRLNGRVTRLVDSKNFINRY